jgi:hypothetical protein
MRTSRLAEYHETPAADMSINLSPAKFATSS